MPSEEASFLRRLVSPSTAMPLWARQARKFEKGVVGPLLANGGAGTVSRIHDGFIRQNQKFLVDRAQNLLERATPEIGSADTPGKKRISGEQLPCILAGFAFSLWGEIKRDASRRVARSVQHIRLERAPTQRVALAQQFIDVSRVRRAHADPSGLHVEMTIEVYIIAMHEHRRAGGQLHFA